MRSSSLDKYRYGFNGIERDDNLVGLGNSLSSEFRQYDPRLGRWTSLDPLMSLFPFQSPYVAFDNNPIYFIDPWGLAAVNGGEPPVGSTCIDENDRSLIYEGNGNWGDLNSYLPPGGITQAFYWAHSLHTSNGNNLTIWSSPQYKNQAYNDLWKNTYSWHRSWEANVAIFDAAWRFYVEFAYYSRTHGKEALDKRLNEIVNKKTVGGGYQVNEADLEEFLMEIAIHQQAFTNMKMLMNALSISVGALSFGRVGGNNGYKKTESPKEMTAAKLNNGKSINQLNKLVQTGKAPKSIKRFDVAKIKGEKDHVHFDNGAALNIDGTWKHGSKVLTKEEIKFLVENGWTIPK